MEITKAQNVLGRQWQVKASGQSYKPKELSLRSKLSQPSDKDWHTQRTLQTSSPLSVSGASSFPVMQFYFGRLLSEGLPSLNPECLVKISLEHYSKYY